MYLWVVCQAFTTIKIKSQTQLYKLALWEKKCDLTAEKKISAKANCFWFRLGTVFNQVAGGG